jgi:hypothetical protein
MTVSPSPPTCDHIKGRNPPLMFNRSGKDIPGLVPNDDVERFGLTKIAILR